MSHRQLEIERSGDQHRAGDAACQYIGECSLLHMCMYVCMYVRVKCNGLRSLLVQSAFEGLTLISRFNLQAPCVLYIGQTYRSSSQYSFYIFSQKIYLIIFLEFLSPSSFIPPQNVLYLLMLRFLVHKIFTFYTNGVVNCKYPAPGPKGQIKTGWVPCQLRQRIKIARQQTLMRGLHMLG